MNEGEPFAANRPGAVETAVRDTPDLAGYRAGVVDGARWQREGKIITQRRMVAINDEYSAGFRAGYFQRDR